MTRLEHTYGVIHAVVECKDCGWGSTSYKNAQALAAQHARRYGHRVVGELGIGFSYEPAGGGERSDDGGAT